jgi:hypothetical protein
MEYRVNALIVLSIFRTVTSWLRLPYATNVNNVIASFSICLSHTPTTRLLHNSSNPTSRAPPVHSPSPWLRNAINNWLHHLF